MDKLLKKKIGILTILVAVVLVMIGSSYAWLRITLTSKEVNTVTVGNLQLELGDKTSEGINLEYAIPISDKKGMELDGYDFDLTNTGEINSRYTIYLDDIPLDDETLRMPDEKIKYVLIKNGDVKEAKLLSTTGKNPKRRLDMGILTPGEENHYTLKLWIDYDASNEVMGKIFSGTIRIEAYQEEVDNEEDISNDKEIEVDLDDEEKKKIDIGDKDPSDYEFTSSDKDKVEIDEEGKITPKEPGEVVITITDKETGEKEEIVIVVTKTLTATYQKGSYINSIGKETDSCKIGRENKMSCEVDLPSIEVEEGRTLIGWSENSESKTGLKPNTSISISEDKTYYALGRKTAWGDISNDKEIEVDLDDEEKKKIDLDGKDPSDYEFTSSDKDKVEIDEEGTIIPKEPGEVVITITDKETGEKEEIVIVVTKTLTITYHKNGVVESIGKEIDSCTIGRKNNMSCEVDLPTIIPKDGYTVVGWGEDVNQLEGISPGKKISLTSDQEMYTIVKKEAKTLSATFHLNGAKTLDQEEQDIKRSCVIEETYQEQIQKTSCDIKVPVIEADQNTTPIVIGYNENQDAIIASITGDVLTLTEDKDYYAITKRESKDISVTYYLNGAESFTVGEEEYKEDHATKICKTKVAYNGAKKEQCSFTAAKIKAREETKEVIGWSKNENLHEAEYKQGEENIKIEESINLYAQTKSSEKNYTVKDYQAGSNVVSVGSKTKENSSCVIPSTYNGVEQSKSCTVTPPNIEAKKGYETIGWATEEDAGSGMDPIILTSSNTGKDWYANAYYGSYKINYYDGDTLMATEGFQSGQNKKITSIKTLGIKEGYSFVGWAVTNQGEVKYQDEERIKKIPVGQDRVVNLYAVWIDDVAPVCSFSKIENITVGETKEIILTCKDPGSGMPLKNLTLDNFMISNTNGRIENISSPIEIENGYQYTITIVGESTGQFDVSLNQGTVVDHLGNVLEESIHQNIQVVGKVLTATFTLQGAGLKPLTTTSKSCTTEGSSRSCHIMLPELEVEEGLENEYTAIGWNTNLKAREGLNPNTDIELSENQTFYSISKKHERDVTISFHKNGADSQDSSSEEILTKTCTVEEIYNNEMENDYCLIEMPVITPNSNTPTVLGYAKNSEAKQGSINQGNEKISLPFTKDEDYYAITRKDEVTNHANFISQSSGITNVEEVENSCKIEATYNGEKQAESCTIDAPTITVREGYTVIGWNEDKNATTSLTENEKLSLTKDTDYYTIVKKDAITYQATFHINGAIALDNRNEDIKRSCTIKEVYNEEEQALSCEIQTPIITPSNETPNVLGYAESADATVVTNSHNAKASLSSNKEYYAITTKPAKTIKITFYKNGALSLDQKQDDYQEKSCTILQTYNGEAQKTSCKVTSPTIEASDNTPTVIGYSKSASKHKNEWDASQEKEVEENANYYAQTKKEKVTHTTGNFDPGDDEGVEGITTTDPVSCDIEEVYNGEVQATSCTITPENLPTVNTKPGYHVIGWTPGTKPDSTPVLNITIDGDGEIYYPHTAKNSYVIKYYDGDIEKGMTIAKVGTTVNLTSQTALDLSKTGYNFKGWTKTKGNDIVEYIDQAGVKDLTLKQDEIINLYAVWVDDIGPSCSFTGEGTMTFGTAKQLTLTCTDNGSGISPQTLSAENFTIENGSISSISEPTTVTNGYQYTIVVNAASTGILNVKLNKEVVRDNLGNPNQEVLSKTMTVNGKTYTATFTKQGSGVTSIGSTTVSCTTEGSSNTCTIELPIITVSSGYTAVGWNTNRNATTATAAGATLTLSGNTTYYSISYQNEKTYSASWNGNGAGLSSTADTSCTIAKAYNGEAQATGCTITSPNIIRSGFTISGYSTNKDAATADSSIPVNGTMTLTSSNNGTTYYAITSLTVTATFNKNGATSIGSTSTSCTIRNNATSCNVTAPTITRSGYDIIGWNTDSNATTSTWNVGTSKSINSNVSYYAITSKDVTITWNKNGATSIGSTSTSCTIKNSATSCSITSPTITRSGYNIIGWNTTSDAAISTWNVGVVKNVSNSVTYYAITSYAYTYNEDSSASNYCVTGDESTCKATTCYKNKTKGSCPAGTIVNYKVNDSTTVRFHVMYDNGGTLTMQSQRNTIYNTYWNTKVGTLSDGTTIIQGDNTKGPLIILPALEKATSNWTNVNAQTYKMGTTLFANNRYTGCSAYNNCATYTYTLSQRTAKARMITTQEATNLGCTTHNGSCPIWMYNYLSKPSSNIGATAYDANANACYWTMNANSNDNYNALIITQYGTNFGEASANAPVFGARAVVVINK